MTILALAAPTLALLLPVVVLVVQAGSLRRAGSPPPSNCNATAEVSK